MSEDFWFRLKASEVTQRLLCNREYIYVTECHMANDATYDKNVNGDIFFVELPPNNAMQSQAIQSALTTSIYFIYGPPGTGKINTETKPIYFFHEMNKRKQMDQDGTYGKITVCGPSNKSVDLVARRLLQQTNAEGPHIVCINGASVKQTAFSMLDRVFSNKRKIDYKLDSDTNAILMLHLIRKNKQYSEGISKNEENFKRNPASIDSETIMRYISSKKATSIDEIRNHDVVLCTTPMASSPRWLDAIVNNIHQLMIAQCGTYMNTEQVSLNIAILIDDHTQLRPIAMFKQAADLGLETSLFEKYFKPPVKFVQLSELYILKNLIYRFLRQTFYEASLFTSKSLSYEEKQRLSIWINEEGIHREERNIFCHVEEHEEATKVSTEGQYENSFNNIEEINQAAKILRHLHDEDRLFANQNIKLISNIMFRSNAMTTAFKKEKLEQYFDVHTVVPSQECSSSAKKIQCNVGIFLVNKTPLLSATTSNRISNTTFENRNFKEMVNSLTKTYAEVEFLSHISNFVEFIIEFRVRRYMHMTQSTMIFESGWFVEDEFIFPALLMDFLKVRMEQCGILWPNVDNIKNSDDSFSISFRDVSCSCVSFDDILSDFNLLNMLSIPYCYNEFLSEISPHDLYKLIIKEFEDANNFTYEHKKNDDFKKKKNDLTTESREIEDLVRDFDSVLCQQLLNLLRIAMDTTEVIIKVYGTAYSFNGGYKFQSI